MMTLKTNMNKYPLSKDKELRKHMLTIILFPFILTSFITLGYSQYFSVAPNWLSFPMILIMAMNLIMMVYGFRLRNRLVSKNQAVYYVAYYFILLSIQCFLGSNVHFYHDISQGRILETTAYFPTALTIYVLIILLMSFIAYIALLSKRPFKQIKSGKTYVLATFIGSLFLVIPVIFMHFLNNMLFEHPDEIADSFVLILAGTPVGYLGIGLLIVMHRFKKRGDI